MRLTADRLLARLESAVDRGSPNRGLDDNDISSILRRKTSKVERAGSSKPIENQMKGNNLRLQALYKIAQQLQRQTSSEAMCQEVVRLLHEDLAYDTAAIYMAQRFGRRLKLIARSGRYAAQSNETDIGNGDTDVLPGMSITSWVAQTGQSVLVGDASQDPRYQASSKEIRSSLCVPMRSAGHTIGVIAVECADIGAFDDQDQVFVETVASQVAAALENNQLATELKAVSSKKEGDTKPLDDVTMAVVLELQEQIEELTELNASIMAQNQDLAAFGHTVAHDIKNPLAILMGFAEVLSQDYLGGEDEILSQGIQVILENGHRLENIIDELLLLAEVRQLEDIKTQPLDMSKIVAETQKRLSNMIAESEAEITAPDSWPEAMGHRPWIQEIWVNYVSNAIKYGGRPPVIELGADTMSDGMVRFWVGDNGPGIFPEDQRRLFAPFTKLYPVRAQGHGLGLSIVRRIATKLGGEVGVESIPGEGSLFWFTLPAKK